MMLTGFGKCNGWIYNYFMSHMRLTFVRISLSGDSP
jgi:hypothetical protein